MKEPSEIEGDQGQRNNYVNGGLAGPIDRRRHSGSNDDPENSEPEPIHTRDFKRLKLALWWRI